MTSADPSVAKVRDIAASLRAGFTWAQIAAAQGHGNPKKAKADFKRLARETNKALATSELKGLWAQQGATVGANNSKDMAAFVSAEIAKWAKVAKSANIQVD